MPKIIIIPSILGGIISRACSLTGMSVKRTIFQAHSSQDSVTFLLTEAQNGNYFSFHYELSLFHLGTAVIDFHSSSILPFLKPLTQTDTMQNAGDLGHTLAILREGSSLSLSVILNIYWKCWDPRCGRLEMLMCHAVFTYPYNVCSLAPNQSEELAEGGRVVNALPEWKARVESLL